MKKELIVIFIIILLIYSILPISANLIVISSNNLALSLTQFDTIISEKIVDNIPPRLDSVGGGSPNPLNMDHPECSFGIEGHDPDGIVIKYFIDYNDGFIDESEWMMNGTYYKINHTFPINIEADYLVQFWCIDVDNASSNKIDIKVYVRRDRSYNFSFDILNPFLLKQAPFNSLDKSNDESLPKSYDAKNTISTFTFVILYGRIVFNGEEFFVQLGGLCYNVTPINVRMRGFVFEFGQSIYFINEKYTEDLLYIPKDLWNCVFIGNNFIFLWISETY